MVRVVCMSQHDVSVTEKLGGGGEVCEGGQQVHARLGGGGGSEGGCALCGHNHKTRRWR